jgi:D-alanyl-D-alanine carboxypeptidase
MTFSERWNEATYYDNEGGRSYNMNVERMDAHGGWIGSTVDLARFLVHFDGFNSKPDLISKSTFDIMTTPSNVNQRKAKGWNVNQRNNVLKNAWHTGSLPGTGAIVVR